MPVDIAKAGKIRGHVLIVVNTCHMALLLNTNVALDFCLAAVPLPRPAALPSDVCLVLLLVIDFAKEKMSVYISACSLVMQCGWRTDRPCISRG